MMTFSKDDSDNKFKDLDSVINSEGIGYKQVKMTDAEFTILKEMVLKDCGIKLNEHKRVFLQSRLVKRVAVSNCKTFTEYIKLVRNNNDEHEEFINTITTNTTHFFREKEHFAFIKNTVIPEYLRKSTAPFTVWSAAASSGEEAYTLSVLFSEIGGFQYRILGTDICTDVLDKAKSAIYKSDAVDTHFPEYLKPKYLLKGSGQNLGSYKVMPELTRNVKFRQFNLLSDSLSTNVRFDLIILRNVLIYFSPETTQKVIDNITRYLKKDGYLIIGLSENLNEITHNLSHIGHSVYKYE